MHHHAEHEHGAGGPGVVLDIGDDVGALVVLLGEHPRVAELDIQPLGDPTARFHTGVHVRDVAGARVRTAVYPAVRAGTYELLDGDGRGFHTLAAVGGAVVTADLR
jgi:hypothetical protein